MVSFQSRLVNGLTKRNIQICFDPDDPTITSILVVGGTRRLGSLWRARTRGVKIVQRLDGMNWLHRKQKTFIRQYLRAESNNLLLTLIRRYFADTIVYQSHFSQSWWENEHGNLSTSSCVIYNGVDLNIYTPNGTAQRQDNHPQILLVEGHLRHENSQGLENAISLVERMNSFHHFPVELVVAGDVAMDVQSEATSRIHNQVRFLGVVPREQIPEIDRSAHLLFSADLNAACPNSVIEALACGLPVLAYDTGALAEMVSDGSGKIVPYGSNHWNLELPKIPPLAEAATKILMENDPYRQAARMRAESVFGVDLMVDRYLQALVL